MAESKAGLPRNAGKERAQKPSRWPLPTSGPFSTSVLKMKSEYLLPYLLFPAVVVSQRIPDILSSNPQLSSLASYVASFPRLAQQFKTADNFTFLAPTNEAFATWLRGNHSSDYIEATLTYHLLNGSHPSASLSSTPLFIPTALTNTTYCNVTGGQRVKALNDGRVVFGSALDTNSTVLAAVSHSGQSFPNRRLTANLGYHSNRRHSSHH